ncbi:hypothetical protein C0J52_08080 [Blattella germanica]|nr:hypothetical protein C0J52_08080 [Blattella germanica]
MMLCLWRSNKLLHIYSDEGELQGIPMKIGMCLPISVSREDGLPHLICSRCIYKLEMFSEFRNSCVRSDQILKRYTLHGVPSTSQVPQLQPMLQTNIQPQLQVQQTHLPQMQNMQQTQFQQQTQIQHIQQIQQEQQIDIKTPESMKMEVIDASPVSIGQEAFMCIVPDQSITSPVSSSEREVQSFIPVIESSHLQGKERIHKRSPIKIKKDQELQQDGIYRNVNIA